MKKKRKPSKATKDEYLSDFESVIKRIVKGDRSTLQDWVHHPMVCRSLLGRKLGFVIQRDLVMSVDGNWLKCYQIKTQPLVIGG